MKKYLFVIILLAFCFPQFLNAENRRHFIILQDNSGSYWEKNNRLKINTIQDAIIALFNNEDKGDGYNLLSKEHSQNILFFDSNNDEITFLWFVADLAGNVNFYNNTNGEYQRFEEYFFTSGVNYSYKKSSKSAETFLKENFSERPKLNSIPYSKGTLNYYSFTSMAYPLCLDVIDADYSEEYIILIISDFKIGSTFGNKQDKSLFETAFKEKSDAVLKRVSFLKGQFVTVDFCDNYVGKGDGMIGYYAYKLRPNAGYPNPENIEVRINSNLIFDQTSFDSDQYSLRESEIVFQHNKDLSISEIGMELFLSSGEKVYKDISSVVQEENGHFKISKINNIVLPNIRNDSSNFDSEIRFVFKGNYSLGGEENASMKYVFDTRQSLNRTNFILKTKLSNTQIAIMIVLIFILLALVIAWFLHTQGKPTGITLHWNRFNDNYETVDFSTDGVGRVHTDYHAWNQTDFERGISIKVEGKYVYNHVGRFYNWKEQTGFPVRITPSLLEFPKGYTMYLTADNKVTNNSNIPIVTDTFEDGRFFFKVMIKKDDYSLIETPLPFKFQIEVAGRSVGLFRKFFYTRNISYSFHVGPELGDVWVGVDPGTTGSCIATATEPDDLTIERTNDGKDKITPSVIVIKTEQLQDDRDDSIRHQTMYGIDAELQKEGEYYRKFVSIKKLLGYNESFVLKNTNELEISVRSSFLSTLLIEGLFNQHKKYLESRPQDFEQFFESGSYAPRRAVFAIPNNFTASKIQHLKSCIQQSTLTSLKDIRFIYEAEAILVNYIHGEDSDLLTSSFGENIFIFDMGGATINATLANIKKRGNIYEISILAKLGYGIGGDTIDYAFLKWIYSKSESYSSLAKNNPFEGAGMTMSKRREIKDNILTLKKQLITNYASGSTNKLLDRRDIAKYFGANLMEDSEGNSSEDVFEKEIQKNSSSFLYGKAFEEYVWNNIESIVKDILVVCKAKGVETLNTVIMSGRSSHFPRVEEIVKKVVNSAFNDAKIKLLGLEESKSAVAKGACYYGVENAKIKLQNRSVNGVFGVIQTLSPNAAPMFHRLIDDGAVFQDGVATGSSPINQEQDFVWNGRKVKFCQVMGVDAEKVIANREKHKYTEIATIKAQPFAVKGVQISVTEKDKVICSITDVNGEIQSPVEGVVNDADIVACNDEQYTFFIK